MADQEVDVSRRDLGALLGALGGAVGLAALSACAGDATADPAPEALGQLKESLNGTTNIQWVDSLQNLRALPGAANYVAILENYHSGGPPDGGGGLFVWSTVAAVDDGGTVLNVGGLGTNAAGWRRIYGSPLNVRWFGALGVGAPTDDSGAIQAAITAAAGGGIFFPKGQYYLASAQTFAAGVDYSVAPGALLVPHSTLTISGTVNAGSYQIFSAPVGVTLSGGNGPINVRWFGAKGDGVTNDAPSIQAAINALPTSGGVVFFPLGTYITNSTLAVNTNPSTIGITLRGQATNGPPNGTGACGSLIYFKGGTPNTAIVANGFRSFRMESLMVQGDAASGLVLLDLSRAGRQYDTTLATIRDCEFHINGTGGGILINMDQCTQSSIESCSFMFGDIAIGGLATQGSYSNANAIKNCYFQYQNVAPIVNPGQSWSICGCSFEALNSGAAGSVSVTVNDQSICRGFSYIGNLHGDVTLGAGGDWLALQGYGMLIAGNLFLSGTAAVDGGIEYGANRGIRFTGASTGVSITGNEFAGNGIAGVDWGAFAHLDHLLVGNRWNSNAQNTSGTQPGGGSILYDDPSTFGFRLQAFRGLAGAFTGVDWRLQIHGGWDGTNDHEGIMEVWSRISVSGNASWGSFPDPGPGGVYVDQNLLLGSTTRGIFHGTGAPTLAAAVGSLYLRTDGGSGSTLYVREGSGWVAK